MTFLNSLKKWFYTNNSSAAGSAARIPLLDAAGNAVGSDTYNAIAQIVRQELATILSGADQGTSGTKFPSIASGVLGSMTAANLASVLGETKGIPSRDFNDVVVNGIYNLYATDALNAPVTGTKMFVLVVSNYSAVDGIAQLCYNLSDSTCYFRTKKQEGAWTAWKNISTDIPDFYKSYNDLSSLVSALGVPLILGNNGVELSDVSLTQITTTCLYGQNKGWPTNFGVGVSIPTGGNYGNLYLCVMNSSGGVGDVWIGFGNPNTVTWAKLSHTTT